MVTHNNSYYTHLKGFCQHFFLKKLKNFGIDFNLSSDNSLYNVEAFTNYIVKKQEVNNNEKEI